MKEPNQILAPELADRLGVGEYELQNLRFEHRLPFFSFPALVGEFAIISSQHGKTRFLGTVSAAAVHDLV